MAAAHFGGDGGPFKTGQQSFNLCSLCYASMIMHSCFFQKMILNVLKMLLFCCVVLILHHCVLICCRTALCFSFKLLNFISVGNFECFLVYICPSDAPTTLPPSTTPPLHPIPADPTALLGTRASDPALAGNRGTVPPDTSPQALPLHPLRFPLCFCSSALRTFPFAL